MVYVSVCYGCLAVPESIPDGATSELPCGVVKPQVLQVTLLWSCTIQVNAAGWRQMIGTLAAGIM